LQNVIHVLTEKLWIIAINTNCRSSETNIIAMTSTSYFVARAGSD